jgi:hypothetical protein
MKIALGHKVVSGPWGGGNRFAAALAKALEARGDKVVFDLDSDDIDLILMTDPRARNPSATFTPGRIFRYRLGHPEAIVLHRINECDERKGTRTMNARLRLANYTADHTVFIASWLSDLDVWRRETPMSVILNGADVSVFNAQGSPSWKEGEPLRLVTHHWGAHASKGFDVYRRLDDLMGEAVWRGRIDFTYVGNLPEGFAFQNARHVPPLDGLALASELKRHHVYITASLNEPAGMHHIEGALCGLPLLYRRSGALPEYCSGYGEMFEGAEDFEEKLEQVMRDYAVYRAALSSYPHTSQVMVQAYLGLIDALTKDRSRLTAAWRPWRDPLAAALIQLPW